MLPHGEKDSFFSESMTHPLSSRPTLFLFQPDHRHPVPSFVALSPLSDVPGHLFQESIVFRG